MTLAHSEVILRVKKGSNKGLSFFPKISYYHLISSFDIISVSTGGKQIYFTEQK